MRLHSGCALATVALLVLPLGGCYFGGHLMGGTLAGAAIGVATTPRTPYSVVGRHRPGAALQVEFSPPREILVVSPNGRDTVRIADATRVIGRVRTSTADSCWLRLTEVRHGSGQAVAWSRDAAPVAIVPLASASRVQLIAANASSSERAVVGAALGFLAMFGWIYWSCRQGRCYGG